MTVSARRIVVCIVWIAVGVLLFWRGMPYTGLRADPDIVGVGDPGVGSLVEGSDTWIALAFGVVLGIGKGLTALKKGARRAVTHIIRSGETAPMWTVFSPTMILLVGLMVAAGLALRLAPYDDGVKAWVVGILYPGIGVALVLGGLLALKVEPLPEKAA